MATKTIGIILNGATGRICSTQHLANALAPIRDEGGLAVNGDRIVPRLMLAGRNAEKLAALAKSYGAEFTTDLDKALADPAFSVFFDAAATSQRQGVLEKAIAAGKNIYSEKPVALSVEKGLGIAARDECARPQARRGRGQARPARACGSCRGLRGEKFFGRVTGFRIDFGWWVFDGTEVTCQRPSWNYQQKTGGGLILDMYPHWRYVIENTLGPIRRVITAMATATPQRIDERGARYEVDVEDNASTLIELESGAIGTIISSWATRVRRDDLLTFQIDGTNGSAIAGLHRCCDHHQRADAAHRAFLHRHRSQRRLPRELARGRGQRAVQEPVPRRLGEFPPPRRDRRADASGFLRRHPRRAVRPSLLSQREGRQHGRQLDARS